MTDQKPEHNSIKERAKKKLERDMGPELLAALNDDLDTPDVSIKVNL